MKISILILVASMSIAFAGPKPDTTLFVKPDTIRVAKLDSFLIIRHYKDSLIFTGADTISKSKMTKIAEVKKPVPVKKQ
jgi:hypothetical protein